MRSALRIRPKAEADLIDIAATIRLRQPDAAERFLIAAAETFDRIADSPGAGRARPDLGDRLGGVRSITIARFRVYVVFYTSASGVVTILRVLHGARELAWLLDDS